MSKKRNFCAWHLPWSKRANIPWPGPFLHRQKNETCPLNLSRGFPGASRQWPHRYLAGHAPSGWELYLYQPPVPSPGIYADTGETLAQAGKTPLFFFAQDGHLTGIIAVADVIKEDSPQAIQELQSMGIQVVMLTGRQCTHSASHRKRGWRQSRNRRRPARWERACIIRQLKEQGRSLWWGTVSTMLPRSPGGHWDRHWRGTDVAIDAADVVLLEKAACVMFPPPSGSAGHPEHSPESVLGLFYNGHHRHPLAAGVFIPLGLTLNPMPGAAAMSLSSFCVAPPMLASESFPACTTGARDKKDQIHSNHCNGATYHGKKQ